MCKVFRGRHAQITHRAHRTPSNHHSINFQPSLVTCNIFLCRHGVTTKNIVVGESFRSSMRGRNCTARVRVLVVALPIVL